MPGRRTFIITRPEEDAARFSEAVRRAGHALLSAPLLRIVFDAQAEIPDQAWQAVAITSANGARAIARHPARAHLITAKAVTVGPASTAAAQAAGFTNILQAERGDVHGVIDVIRSRLDPAAGPVLYASGRVTRGALEEKLAQDGFTVVRVVLYDARPAEALPEETAAFLRRGGEATVALYSPRSAKIWAGLCQKAGLAAPARRLDYACLSANVARALKEALNPEREPLIAPKPEEGALLALLGLTPTGESTP